MNYQKVLEQSQKIDRLHLEYYRTKNAALKEELRIEQDALDKMVLGRRLHQSEIDQLIERGCIK